MRHHFHRCRHLRVLSLQASDLSGGWKGGGPILEELCDRMALARCIGLVDCDVLALPEKRQLLGRRVVRARDTAEDPGADLLFEGTSQHRALELTEVRETLIEERSRLVEENRRLVAELTAGIDLRDDASPHEEAELTASGISVRLDEQVRAFRSARLDAIDRALEAMTGGPYGQCARCGAPIEATRLCAAPDTLACSRCARNAGSEQMGRDGGL